MVQEGNYFTGLVQEGNYFTGQPKNLLSRRY